MWAMSIQSDISGLTTWVPGCFICSEAESQYTRWLYSQYMNEDQTNTCKKNTKKKTDWNICSNKFCYLFLVLGYRREKRLLTNREGRHPGWMKYSKQLKKKILNHILNVWNQYRNIKSASIFQPLLSTTWMATLGSQNITKIQYIYTF